MSTRILRIYVRILRIAIRISDRQSGYSGLPFGYPIGNPDTLDICSDIPDIKFLFEREKNFFYFTVCRHLAHGKGAPSPCVQPKHTAKLDGVDRPLELGADGTPGKNFAVCRVPAFGTRQSCVFAVCLRLGTRQSLISPCAGSSPCVFCMAHGKAAFRRVPVDLHTVKI